MEFDTKKREKYLYETYIQMADMAIKTGGEEHMWIDLFEEFYSIMERFLSKVIWIIE